MLPAATFDVPSSVPFGDSFTLILADAHVPGHPEATGFTYAFDCGDDTGCEVIGYTYAGVEGHDYMALRGPAGVLHDVVVDPAHRGHGIGRMP